MQASYGSEQPLREIAMVMGSIIIQVRFNHCLVDLNTLLNFSGTFLLLSGTAYFSYSNLVYVSSADLVFVRIGIVTITSDFWSSYWWRVNLFSTILAINALPETLIISITNKVDLNVCLWIN